MLIASLLSALLMGLIGSTHCVGMCGGIISTLSTNFSGQSQGHSFSIQLFYNLGRISTYSFFGLMIGFFSSKLMELLPDPHAFSMKIAGVFFILLGLYISQLLNSFKYFEAAGQKLWVKIEPFGRHYLPAQTPFAALKLGLVWGWLPCGLVYSALALAMTQLNPLHSALTMFAFGLGTLPTLLLIGHFAQNVKNILQNKRVRIILGLILIVYGITQILGYSTFMMHAH
ncbi:MAG: sulfite exporter TauE/SafE family protein [Gammaproteobacteria bacterium]|nr:sulfite exporter TauE/SafE family protein [Gammaproteobacteria bacterium]